MDLTRVISEITDIPKKKDRVIAFVRLLFHLENLRNNISFQPSNIPWIDFTNQELKDDIDTELDKHIKDIHQWLDFELEE